MAAGRGTKAEHYILQVIDGLGGQAIGKGPLLRKAAEAWETTEGRFSDSALRTALTELLERGTLTQQTRASGTYIRRS